MTADQQHHIDYETLAQAAMRGMVRTVLMRVAKSGLPGEHHFYIAFKTDAPGVILSKRLKEKYPEEMTVVLQHRFWDLIVSDERFEVKLTFDGIPERLGVPFAAIKVFFDPSVPYGLQFEDLDGARTEEAELPATKGQSSAARAVVAAEPDGGSPRGASQARADKKPRANRRPQPEKVVERPVEATDKVPAKHPPADAAKPAEPSPAPGPKVVSIDAFRKK